MTDNKVFPVILCGGSGTRLWPLSRKSYPKQFISINSNNEKSLLQQTQARLLNLNELDAPILICNDEHRFIVAEQMRKINVNPNAIILEPIGRNTAPAIALAALQALKISKDPTLLVLASDHLIKGDEVFYKTLKKSFKLADEGRLVTFGIKPTQPNTGFGYIESQQNLDLETLEASEISKFVEKPNLELAKKFFMDKKYSWNSGMFVFKAKKVINEMNKYCPEIVEYCSEAIKSCTNDLDFKRIDAKIFRECPSISLDIAVMEKTKYGSVLPLNVKWTDIGNWASLWEYETKNEDGNFTKGRVVLKNVQDSLFYSSNEKLLVGLGLKNLILINTDDAILISEKKYAQEVKDVVMELEKQGIEEASSSKKGYRPWGFYKSLANGKTWQVKLIEVNPGASLSLQKHKFRAEHWIVVKGTALVRIEDEEFMLKENQSTYIPLGTKHQLSNPFNEILNIIEIQSGSYLGEDDIVRFQDKYGR